MKIRDAHYLKSAMQQQDYPKDRRPEIAFVGRSNVGKSSLLNALMKTKGLAKTSSTPGKTQTINFFEINRRFYFVDLPGYGYAKVPLQLKKKWGQVMTAYLKNRETLCLVVHLLDARHKPTDRDADMLEMLDQAEVPTLIVATKIDKLKRAERKKNLQQIRDTLELHEDAAVAPFSAVTGEGREDILDIIREIIEDASE